MFVWWCVSYFCVIPISTSSASASRRSCRVEEGDVVVAVDVRLPEILNTVRPNFIFFALFFLLDLWRTCRKNVPSHVLNLRWQSFILKKRWHLSHSRSFPRCCCGKTAVIPKSSGTVYQHCTFGIASALLGHSGLLLYGR